MNIEPVYMVHLTGNIPGDSPCFCMRCPECRGYVMETRRPVDPDSRLRDWKPSRKDLKAQAEAMEVEANEGRPAVLRRDMEQPKRVGRPRKSGEPQRTKQQAALDAINERIAKTEAKLLRLKAEREKTA